MDLGSSRRTGSMLREYLDSEGIFRAWELNRQFLALHPGDIMMPLSRLEVGLVG